MGPITIRQVYDDRSAFSHLELLQGSNCIKISLAQSTLDIQKASYKWDLLKKRIDEHLASITKDTLHIDPVYETLLTSKLIKR